eukprot:TRINITY_DN1413_c0_g1::TRINITY_DN1413_c0_g1_i2::g.27309::m.27309 TRINITY_DN1413_c0_g1::TRINITY_DN1413_c0_g1_i2::g.27309  ORF type:complete len:116 (+),score=1.29,DUF4050/PF13259.1/0.16 TRINITY_DN1413_c0_g1_i2:483-830(+)
MLFLRTHLVQTLPPFCTPLCLQVLAPKASVTILIALSLGPQDEGQEEEVQAQECLIQGGGVWMSRRDLWTCIHYLLTSLVYTLATCLAPPLPGAPTTRTPAASAMTCRSLILLSL